jgi:hypothetical protein
MNKNNRLDKLEGEARSDDVFIRVLFEDDLTGLYSDSFEDDAEWTSKEDAIKNYPKDKMIRVPGISESNI